MSLLSVTPTACHSFIHSFLHSFIHSFLHSFIPSFIHFTGVPALFARYRLGVPDSWFCAPTCSNTRHARHAGELACCHTHKLSYSQAVTFTSCYIHKLLHSQAVTPTSCHSHKLLHSQAVVRRRCHAHNLSYPHVVHMQVLL